MLTRRDQPDAFAAGGDKSHQPRSAGLRITRGKPKVHNRLETPEARSKREAGRLRVQEHRERSRMLADFECDCRLLTWFLTRRRPTTRLPYLAEREVALGLSARRADQRAFRLALRRATTDFFDDLLAGRIV